MKRKKGLRKILNITKLLFATFICLSIIIQAYDSTLGEEIKVETYYIVGEGDKTYDFQELLSKYKANSVTYKRNMMEYRIQALDGKLADENHASIEAQYLDVANAIEELENTRKALYEYKEEMNYISFTPINNGPNFIGHIYEARYLVLKEKNNMNNSDYFLYIKAF